MKPSIYLETTIVSYLTARARSGRDPVAAARQQITTAWWQNIRPRFDLYVSPVVLEEASRGNPNSAAARLAVLQDLPILEAPPQLEDLARSYMAAIRLPDRVAADAYHLAFAASHGLGFLLTWNCTHIANGYVRQQIDRVNAERGIATPVICTPEELMEVPDDGW